jgi:hypothetical protein
MTYLGCNYSCHDLSVMPFGLYTLQLNLKKKWIHRLDDFGYGSIDCGKYMIIGPMFVVQTLELSQLKWHILPNPIFVS